jgi:hypothetical protein
MRRFACSNLRSGDWEEIVILGLGNGFSSDITGPGLTLFPGLRRGGGRRLDAPESVALLDGGSMYLGAFFYSVGKKGYSRTGNAGKLRSLALLI